MNIAVLILAAGNSSRMGSPKQLLPVGKKTLLGIAVESALKSKANTTYCVLGANAEKIAKSLEHYNVELILNPDYNKGLSSSITAGIDYIFPLNFDAVLVTLGDQPFVDSIFLNKMIDSFHKNPLLISASRYAKNFGVPAIFPKSYFQQLQKLDGDKGAKELLNSQKTPIRAIQTQIITDLFDIDTPKDYTAFKDKKKQKS